MPTRKTAKNTKTSALKKTSRTTNSKAVSSRKMKQNREVNLLALRNKVMAPKNRRSLLTAIVIIVLAVVLFLLKGFFIAAMVNGQPISRISIVKELEAQSGKSVLDSVITRMLVLQEANNKKISVSDKDVNNEISKIDSQFKEQGQNLDQLLLGQGISKTKFQDEVKIQLLVQKILGDQAKLTDKEFEDFLSKNQSLIENEKDQEAAKKTLRQQLEQQKLAQKYQEWIQNIKKNAKIQYFVNY